MSDQLSLKKFAEIASVIQSLAEPYGIKIAPESLNRSETNVANDLHSMAYALREVGVGFTADSYHILREAFSDSREIDWVHEIPFLPEHVHFADFPRHLPTREDPMIVGFIRRLKDLGYDRRVSFEGTLAEHSLAEAADRLNQLWTL